MFSFIQSLRQRATEGTPFVEENTTQAQEGTTLTSLLSGVATTVKQIQSSVSEQLSTIIQEEAQATNTSATPSSNEVYLPWEDPSLPEHWRGFEVELKRNILYIPRNRSVFLFDRKTPKEWNPAVAMKLLDVDPYLQEAQYKLVPKTVSEEIFFQNYFAQVDNIVNFQRPAQHYFTVIQKSLQTGENLETNAKHVQILKKRIAEQLIAFENTEYYDELIKLNDVCKHVLVQASRKYTAMNNSTSASSSNTSAPATPTTTNVKQEIKPEEASASKAAPVEEQHTETDEANVASYGDSDDEDVKLPWEEDEETEE